MKVGDIYEVIDSDQVVYKIFKIVSLYAPYTAVCIKPGTLYESNGKPSILDIGNAYCQGYCHLIGHEELSLLEKLVYGA